MKKTAIALLRKAVSQLFCSGSFYLCYISPNLSTPADLAAGEGEARSIATTEGGEKKKYSGVFYLFQKFSLQSKCFLGIGCPHEILHSVGKCSVVTHKNNLAPRQESCPERELPSL